MLPASSCSTKVRVPCRTRASRRRTARRAGRREWPRPPPRRRRAAPRRRRRTRRTGPGRCCRPPTQATTASGSRPVCVEALRPRLLADDRLELAHHQRIRMRPERRAEQVVGVADVGHPVAHRLVDGVLQRAAARIHAAHRRAEQAHAEHVERLPRHVVGAHVDDALEPSSAQTVAVATPCWPAPVSATMRRLPMRTREQRLARARC